MVVPKSASDVLRQVSPRKMIGNSFFSQNRFSNLRESSPVARSISRNGRDRSQSVKRKIDSGQISYARVTAGPDKVVQDEATLAQIEAASLDLAKVQSLSTKISESILNLDVDDPIKAILNDMCDAIGGLGRVQEGILTSLKTKAVGASPPLATQHSVNYRADGASMFSLGNVPKKHKSHTDSGNRFFLPKVDSLQILSGQSELDSLGIGSQLIPPQQNVGPLFMDEDEQEDPVHKKFKDAVKEAEKATLVFNLDMGRFPTLNQDKMASQATLALTKMAAAKEGKVGLPSEEAIAAIDDVTSVTKSMAFFGKSTKPCKGSKKTDNAAFYTVPVKYEFKDKETRVRAEQILRQTCAIQCSTPYPPILRECIRQTINEIKVDHPHDFIRVNVDAKNKSLRAFIRPQGEGMEWRKLSVPIPLPEEAMDVTSRSIPEGLKIALPVDIYSPGRTSRKDRHLSEKTKSPEKGNE